ncbi:MAG: hypothetical protein A4E66_02176 [Syntrophus sp. PtaB.Bin001]|nr:MAG: hypothetical protein A4E66_02176 [Syntrophus sp. PtaB.Bin001]
MMTTAGREIKAASSNDGKRKALAATAKREKIVM